MYLGLRLEARPCVVPTARAHERTHDPRGRAVPRRATAGGRWRGEVTGVRGASGRCAPPVQGGHTQADRKHTINGCPSTPAHRGQERLAPRTGHYGRRALRRAAGRGGGGRVNGVLKDLSTPLQDGVVVETGARE
ncbi:hypothetical protein QJS66_04355 [Kocuria rhizophila]|nr:hypothetical protein QJS66_04355 [Kocuria rhizophila]